MLKLAVCSIVSNLNDDVDCAGETNHQVPVGMRSVSQALNLLTYAFGSSVRVVLYMGTASTR